MTHTPDYPAWPLDQLHQELLDKIVTMAPLIAELANREVPDIPMTVWPSPLATPSRAAQEPPSWPWTAPPCTPRLTPPVGLGQTALTLDEFITEVGRFSASTWPTLARDDELARLLDALQTLGEKIIDAQDARCDDTAPGLDHPCYWQARPETCHP